MSETEHTVAAQVELYGEPLGDLFGRITAGLGVSQAQLARILGMSPPMLSQLGSGKRAKIGNPAVQRRLSEIVELLDDVRSGAVSGDDLAAALEQVRESTGSWTTARHEASADPAPVVRAVLRGAAGPEELARAADLLEPDHPALAAVIRDYGVGEPGRASSPSSSSTQTS